MAPSVLLPVPRERRGFTLLGVLIAVAFVVIASLGVAGLAQQTGRAGRLAQNRLVATYLAREGVELVRSLRDDNFLTFQDSSVPAKPRCETASCALFWRGDPASSDLQKKRRAICNNNSATPHWVIDLFSCLEDCGGDDGPALVAPTGAALNGELYLAPDGTYTHSGAAPNVSTPFRRLVEITTLTQSFDVGTEIDNCGETYDMSAVDPSRPKAFAVRVTVAWEDRGEKSVELVEELYPWMRYRE